MSRYKQSFLMYTVGWDVQAGNLFFLFFEMFRRWHISASKCCHKNIKNKMFSVVVCFFVFCRTSSESGKCLILLFSQEIKKFVFQLFFRIFSSMLTSCSKKSKRCLVYLFLLALCIVSLFEKNWIRVAIPCWLRGELVFRMFSFRSCKFKSTYRCDGF